MPALSFDKIAHKIKTVFQRHYPSPVRNRLRQSLIAIMAGHQQIECGALNPLLDFRLREPLPGKWPRGLGLICTVHAQRVVHRGSPK